METGRFLLAIILMIAVIVGTNRLFGPRPIGEQPAAEAVLDTLGVTGEGVEAEPSEPAIAAQTVAPAAPGEAADTVIAASSLYRYGFSTRGASVVVADLLQFESFTQPGSVNLVPAGAKPLFSYRVRVGDRIVDLSNLPFMVERIPVDNGGETLRFTYREPEGEFGVRIEYILDPEEYVIRAQGAVEGLAGGSAQILLDLGPTLASNEADPREDERALAFAVNSVREGILSVPLRNVRSERIEEGPLRWVALKSKYFLAAVLNPEIGQDGAFGGVIARPTGVQNQVDLTTTLSLQGDSTFAFRLFMGPQEYDRLRALGDGMQDVNPYGWRVLRPIIRPLGHLITWALVGLHSTLNLGYGWVLILFGVLIRVILWPLNTRAMRAQMKNMALQPRLQEIQEKYKDNPEQLQKEMSRLIREEGFNPFGGCLPLLIPFPVLITLFFVFQNTIEFRGVEFLWLPDLSRPDPLYILPFILGGSMFLMQWISSRTAPPNPQMKMMMYFMPAFMVVLFLQFASGLNLYYAAQNLASIPQQIMLNRERRRHQEAAARRA